MDSLHAAGSRRGSTFPFPRLPEITVLEEQDPEMNLEAEFSKP